MTLYIANKSESYTARFMCVADNTYMIEWMVNGSVVECGYSTHQGTAYSVLPLPVTYDHDETEVICVVRNLRRTKNFTSQPAVISVVCK